MKRVEILKEQAAVLRSLAASFDDPTIRADLLNLADRCEQMAAAAARFISDRMQQPINQKPSTSVDGA